VAPIGKPRRRVVVEPLRETRPARAPERGPVKEPGRRQLAPAK